MFEIHCDACPTLLDDCAAGTLPEDTRRVLEAHIESCEGCARLVHDYLVLPALVQQATDVRMPYEVELRLRRLLAAARRREA
jgi:anti-sigma factor RsiW